MLLLLLCQEALIHLGAKFAPCMRQDQQVHSFISATREKEKHSACCVRNDKSGCVQTAEKECSVSPCFAHSHQAVLENVVPVPPAGCPSKQQLCLGSLLLFFCSPPWQSG